MKVNINETILTFQWTDETPAEVDQKAFALTFQKSLDPCYTKSKNIFLNLNFLLHGSKRDDTVEN